jgi:hypothetical protein
LAVDRISVHEVRLLLAFQAKADSWLTNAEVAEAAGISPRTALMHGSQLVKLSLLDVQRLFLDRRFRLGRQPGDEGQAYLDRWEKAREVYGA